MRVSFEADFADALLNPDRPVPFGITAPDPAALARRFAVHRNNRMLGLVNALRRHFPVVEKLVGEDFFKGLARAYVTAEPPRSPLITRYGDSFPAFIKGFEPAAELPYLADVARLEIARIRAYHAADATALGAAHFAMLDGQLAEDLRIALHPSTEIIRSPDPIVTIWAMNSGERDLATIEPWRAEDALVARPGLDVEVRALPPGGAAFLQALASGATLGEAAITALADARNFDLTSNLAGMIDAGLAVKPGLFRGPHP